VLQQTFSIFSDKQGYYPVHLIHRHFGWTYY